MIFFISLNFALKQIFSLPIITQLLEYKKFIAPNMLFTIARLSWAIETKVKNQYS